MKQFIPENGVYVTFRYNAQKTIMVIANNNMVDKDLNLGRFKEIISEKTVGVEITTGTKYSMLNLVSIPEKTVLILEIN